LLASLSDLPSVAPGVVSLGIGDQFTSIFYFKRGYLPQKAWGAVDVSLVGIAPGTKLYFQAAHHDDATNQFMVSSVQSVTVLF